MPDNTFLFYLTLYTDKPFVLPASRSIVGDNAHAHYITTNKWSRGPTAVHMYTNSPVEHLGGEGQGVEWNSLGVSYTADEESISFEVVGLPTYLYGFYSGNNALLAITNIADMDTFVQASCRNDWWAYRFKPMQAFSVKLMPARLTAKWVKWSGMETGKRFAALEANLFSLNSYESRP